jgi:hypothetical protein
MVQGVAAYAALDTAAASAVATGQAGRSGRGQVMADLLIERLTGQHSADAIPVEVHLVMTDAAIFGSTSARRDATRPAPAADGTDDLDPTHTPAWLVGTGPIPAATARDLLNPTHDESTGRARVWLRRLYTHPDTGHLVAMDSRRRLFDGLRRRMLLLRDATCRTPWCDAPIRHADHSEPHHTGGRTSCTNGSGLCARCNHTKETDHWDHRANPDHLDITTPTGHTYQAPTRPLVGSPGSPAVLRR